MKVAVLERFADLSRRCDPEAIGGGQDELAVWNVIGDWNGWNSEATPLAARPDGSGIWEGAAPAARHGQADKYRIASREGGQGN